MAADGDDLPAFTLETGTSVEALRDAKAESWATLDHRITLAREIDDKATRLIRTNVVVLGIVVSAVGVAGPRTIGTLDVAVVALSVVGGIGLLASIFVGVGLYTVSGRDIGVSASYRDDVRRGSYSEREWLRTVLVGYDEWDADVAALNRRKEWYLLASQLVLLTALLALATATGLLLVAHRTPIRW
jgi:hypothetical protein